MITGPRLGALGMQHLPVQRSALDVAQRHRHFAASAVDLDLAEELVAGRGRQVRLPLRGRFLKDHLRPEGVVRLARAERARVHRA